MGPFGIRQNCMGKRVDFTGRDVITSDPDPIEKDQVVVEGQVRILGCYEDEQEKEKNMEEPNQKEHIENKAVVDAQGQIRILGCLEDKK